MLTIIPLLADMSGNRFIDAFIWVVIAGVIFWLLNWLIGYIQIPEPFSKILRVIIGIGAVIILINALLMFTSHGGFITW